MLIIPNDILFKYATANNEVTESLFDHQMGVVSCVNWPLILIDLKLMIIDFRITVDSQP